MILDLTDVRRTADLSDYTGDLNTRVSSRSRTAGQATVQTAPR